MNRRLHLVVVPVWIAALVGVAMSTVVTHSRANAARPPIVLQYGERPPWLVAALAAADGQDVVGRTMPPLHFDRWVNTDGGKPIETAGKVTLYRWWTDGCAHCEKTLPAVEALRQKYGPRGLQVVAVYHPKPPRDVSDADVKAWAKGMGYAGPIALDLNWSELKRFYLDKARRNATSASFLVDRDGVIRFAHPGPRFDPSDDPADARENADYRRVEDVVRDCLGVAP
jgi:thiol-disulfide isomerase/thioredoxin